MDNRGAIVLCSDAGWAWQSVYQINKSFQSDVDKTLDHFLYLIGDIDNRIIDAVETGITVVAFQDYPKELNFAFDTENHVPKGSMIRLLALMELSQKYDRVIYLDGDAFLNWGSTADFLLIPNTGRPLCAVRNRSHWPKNQHAQYNQKYIDALSPSIGEHYLNSGVLLVNSKAYLENEITPKALRFYVDNPDRCKFGDQSALNWALVNNWDELSASWNWQVSQNTLPLMAGRQPRIAHFTGPRKPWNDSFRMFDQKFFLDMLSFLRKNDMEDLIPQNSPLSFTLSMERKRGKKMDSWMGNTFAKRELLKEFLDSDHFIDVASGITSFATQK